MGEKKAKSTCSRNSWREIPQSGVQGVSPQSKKRRRLVLLKTGSLIFGFLVMGLLIMLSVMFYKKHSSLNILAPAVKYIDIESDGVLTELQLLPFIGLGEGVGLMEVDIFDLKERIEKIGQVRSAIVERQFPDTLKISISEYKPIVKIVTVDGKGKRRGFLVSEEGHVFKGYGYTAKKLKELPYLTGIRLHRKGNSFKSILHMDCVSQLLRCAQLESPHLYKYWKSISFEYCQNGNVGLGSFIEVKTRNLGELIFAPDKFELQLNRLNTIVAYASKQKLATIERIDLSLGSQAVVKVGRGRL